jgi:hypothetical protein
MREPTPFIGLHERIAFSAHCGVSCLWRQRRTWNVGHASDFWAGNRRAESRGRRTREAATSRATAATPGRNLRGPAVDNLELTPNHVLDPKTDQEWSTNLEAALTATRREDPQHGTNAAYVYGCVCSDCRAQLGTPGSAAQRWKFPQNSSGRAWSAPGLSAPGFGPSCCGAPSPKWDIDRSSLGNDRKVRVMTAGNIAIDEDHLILMERLSAAI